MFSFRPVDWRFSAFALLSLFKSLKVVLVAKMTFLPIVFALACSFLTRADLLTRFCRWRFRKVVNRNTDSQFRSLRNISSNACFCSTRSFLFFFSS